MRTGGFPELVCGASPDGGTVVTLDYESSRGETENRSGRPVGVLGSYPRNPIPFRGSGGCQRPARSCGDPRKMGEARKRRVAVVGRGNQEPLRPQADARRGLNTASGSGRRSARPAAPVARCYSFVQSPFLALPSANSPEPRRVAGTRKDGLYEQNHWRRDQASHASSSHHDSRSRSAHEHHDETGPRSPRKGRRRSLHVSRLG